MSELSPGWRVFGGRPLLQKPFDIAVIMPTIGRASILEAVSSVYAQNSRFHIQLIIGVDVPAGDFAKLEALLNVAPPHITPVLYYPGYSTSVRHGGMHPARDGGSLRTTLSYLANAKYLAYLDDDNWWDSDNLDRLSEAIQGKAWAFSLRRFLHPASRQPVGDDLWESVGLKKGIFAEKFGGFVDPNCLLIDKLQCEPVLRWWGIPLINDAQGMSADRHVYHWLAQNFIPGETGKVTVNYVMQANDPLHPVRLQHIGNDQYNSAEIFK